MLQNGFASGLIEDSRKNLAKFNLCPNFSRYSMRTSIHLQLIIFAGFHILSIADISAIQQTCFHYPLFEPSTQGGHPSIWMQSMLSRFHKT